MKTRRIHKISKLWLALAGVFALSLLGHAFGYDIWQPPPEQPEQISSMVDYDPKLTDRFFESDQRSCRRGYIKGATCRDGKPVLILSPPCNKTWRSVLYEEECPIEVPEWTCPDGCKECATCERGRPLLKHTAKCYSTSFGFKHEVRFCEARFVDVNMIDLLIHDSDPATSDSLLIRIRNGKFTCLYWNHDGGGGWTTTQQKLILEKKTYQKGDVIKGRIDFLSLNELNKPLFRLSPSYPYGVKVYGVLKTIVE